MKAVLRLVLGWALLLTEAVAMAQPKLPFSSPHLADYDAELRRADSHVDTDAMVARLKALGVTTYYWLIWHAATDWEDLKTFLPKAAQAHIEVWAYLVPPTEGPPGGYPASEPFKLDYPRWAEELARLSLQQTNLTGWVIDDFYANRGLFTPAYLRQMQTRAKAVNPRFAFLPLMYFPEITAQFAENYREVIDGVVVAYPQDREEINDARAILNGEAAVKPGQLSCPGSTPTQPGDYVSVSVPAEVLPAGHADLRFDELDDFTGATAGYHFKQLLVDDVVVWDEDVAGGAKDWREVAVDAGAAVRGKTNVTVMFRLFDKKGVSNFGLRWRLRNLRVSGLRLAASLEQPEQWSVKGQGPLEAGFGSSIASSRPRFHIPFIVMTAASSDEFKLRHGEPASPERIAEWMRMSLQAWRQGQCDGVVLYCLDLGPESKVFPRAQQLFRRFRGYF
jgi:hypothetical protein